MTSTLDLPWELRPGWTDIKPITQDDGPNPLVPISYTSEYRNAMDAFRYLVKINERSQRVLELTEVLIRLNPGHYSIWAFRSDTLLAIGADLNKELDLMDDLIKEHLKSYQVWQHRRIIVLALDSPARELTFTSKALAIDAKNYHTWAYRQWVLCHFCGVSKDEVNADVWKGEIDFVESLLNMDLRNNSAWNHRFFVVFESGKGGGDTEEVVERELSYVYEKLGLAPNNASAWNYVRGVMKKSKRSLSSWSLPASKFDSKSHLAVEYLADALYDDCQAESNHVQTKVRESIRAYDRLCQVDPIRIPYYEHRKKQLSKLLD